MAICRTGSISSAAETLERDVSSVSRAVKGLEKALGCELFRHNTRPIVMTDAGKKAHRRMEALLRAHDSLVDDLRNDQRHLAGRVRLTTAQGFATRQLMPILGRFSAEHPEISIDIVTGMREADVAKGRVDVAVLTGEPTLPGLVYVSRGRNVYLPVASPEYVKQFGMPVSPASLKEHRGFLYTGPVRDETKTLSRGTMTAPVEFGTTVRSTDVLAIRQAVLSGQGVAVDLPLVQIYRDLLENRLVPILPGWSRPPIECWLATHRDAWHARRVRIFFDWFSHAMREEFASYERAVAPIVGLPADTVAFDRTEIRFTAARSRSKRATDSKAVNADTL